VSLTVTNGCGEDTATKTGYITAEDCAPIPPAAAAGGGGCPTTQYLTVGWEGNNTTKPLYSNNYLAVDLLGPSLDLSDSLFLEQGTHAPVVDERTYYLIVVRELEEIPPVPENHEAIVVLNVTPTDAEFNKDLFLTLGLNQTQLPQNVLNLTMAYYDDVNGLWERLDYEAGGPNGVAELTLSAPINHFSIYGVLAELGPTPTPPAHFIPSGLSIVPSVEKIWKSITFVTKTGERVTISANVANDGGQEGTYNVVLKLNGQTVDTKTVTIGAGQSKQVSFTRSGLDYGQYDVEVAGLTGEFTTSRTITWWLIILIIVATGLIIWGVVWGRRRRHKAQQEA
jgi:PKD repeat protein